MWIELGGTIFNLEDIHTFEPEEASGWGVKVEKKNGLNHWLPLGCEAERDVLLQVRAAIADKFE